MAPRAYWKGFLKLSLVSCPVKLFSATSSSDKISFNMIHKDTHNRVQMKPHDPELGEVDRKDLVKGYQVEKDRYIIVGPDELKELQIESNKTIDIEAFIDAAEIDPVYYDSPYYLGPDGPVAEEAYTVILEAMQESDRVAIARVVLSGRERLIALRPKKYGFMIMTLRSSSDIRKPDAYFEDMKGVEIDDDMRDLAKHIIEQKTTTFAKYKFEDRYQLALQDLIQAKIKGEAPIISKAPERGKVINLMDALKRSLEEEKRPAAKSKAKKSAAKKKTARKKAAGKSK